MNVQKKSKRNFERHVKVWNGFLCLLGVSPVVSHLNGKGELEYRSSTWMMSLPGLVIAISIFIIYLQTEGYNLDLSNIPKLIITGYLTVLSSSMTITKIIPAVLNSKSYAALSTNFLKFNRNSYRARVCAILLLSIKYVSFYVALLLFSFFYDVSVLDEDTDLISIKFLLHYFPKFYTLLYMCQFAFCCFCLRVYLSDINMEIKNHSQSVINSFDQRLKLFKLSCVFPANFPHVSSTTEMDLSKMKYIRRLYHQVYLLSNQVNKVFSTSVCLILVDCFFLSLFLIYCGLEEVNKYKNNKSSLSVLEIINYFKHSTICFAFIYGLIWPSSKVYYQAEITADLVLEYFAKVPKGELQTEFYNFVIQLYQEKINFSPHGFFCLNNRLFLSIIGSVASSLVILIQFRIRVV